MKIYDVQAFHRGQLVIDKRIQAKSERIAYNITEAELISQIEPELEVQSNDTVQQIGKIEINTREI